MIIKRVGPLSIARIAGVIYAAIGLVAGALVSIFAVFGMALSGIQPGPAQNSLSPLIGGAIGIAAILVLPILYGVLGFLGAWICAWLYNLVSSKVGGIEIDVAQFPTSVTREQ